MLNNYAGGIGLRRDFAEQLLTLQQSQRPQFLEIAPENWIGSHQDELNLLAKLRQEYPIICHGLSLSIGGLQPIDTMFLRVIKQFLSDFDIPIYSDHLSYTYDDIGNVYDLLPIPMVADAVTYVVDRIDQVQNILGQTLILENVSTYLLPHAELSESEFINQLLTRSGCELLLDVNNVFVNSVNHQQDAKQFIDSIPADKVRYLHVAGHYIKQPDLLIDTHGAPICDEVWSLLDYTYQTIGPKPTLLERDFNIPPLVELLDEYNQIQYMLNVYKPIEHYDPTPLSAAAN